ncbi:MAG: hypothetical protein AAGI11_00840 [Pseudomonadota bacterium]
MSTRKRHKAVIFGASGRVGLGLAYRLMTQGIDVVAVDIVEPCLLQQQFNRVQIDARIESDRAGRVLAVFGGFDVMNETRVAELLTAERADVVVNYAIPFTWDATKQLSNYARISRAGLGAFAAIQALAPLTIARAIANSGCDSLFLVGNLPDITIPVIHGCASTLGLALPVCGAGNVGLIEAAIRRELGARRGMNAADLEISLVAHHIHWVAPREPGYRNDAPFLLKVTESGSDISSELGDLRALMNTSIVQGYEPGAGFSSTTALLAAEAIVALLGSERRRLHLPAPLGLPGGYPVIVSEGKVELDLPSEWSDEGVVTAMQQAQGLDGVSEIAADGAIHFDPDSVEILREEMDFDLPISVTPGDLCEVATAQIAAAKFLVDAART